MKRLAVLNFFPAFEPARSGGELRLLNLYRELSRHFRIDLVSWTHPDAERRSVALTPTFTDHRIPRAPAFEAVFAELARQEITGELFGAACALVGRAETPFHTVAAELIAASDCVVHEFPYTLLYDRTIGLDGKPRLYNSHNVETDMVTALTPSAQIHDLVFNLERSLVGQCAGVLATSGLERDKFHCLFGTPIDRIQLCPNGFAEDEFDWVEALGVRERPIAEALTAGFLGSAHPPNLAAARFIVGSLAPAFPATRFALAGSVCAGIGIEPGRNVTLLGPLDEAGKREFLRAADIFLNPIEQGAGTSLKAVDAMAAALPMLTTPIGVRGLDVADGREILVAGLAEFPDRLFELLAKPDLRRELGQAARAAAVARYSWRSIAESMAPVIETLAAAPAAPRPMVLAANDYSIAHPVSGGAVRIDRLLSAVADASDVVVLCFGRGTELEIEALRPGLTEIRVPRTPEHVGIIPRIDWGQPASIDDILAAIYATRTPELTRWFRRLAARSRAIVFEHPYMTPLREIAGVRRRIVVDAHNVEARLKAELLATHTDRDILLPLVEALERHASAIADVVTAATEADAADFQGATTIVIPNGTDPCPESELRAAIEARAGRDWSEGFVAVFMGSAHPPNIEAARFLCQALMPAIPRMELWVIGSVGQFLDEYGENPRLRRFGTVPEAEKRRLLLAADLALNPVTTGGGSSLKIGDFLGHGLPLVTTKLGAEGAGLTDRETCLVAAPGGFAGALAWLASSAEARSRLAAEGYRLAANRLGWDGIGRRFADLVAAGAAPPRALRILVVAETVEEPAIEHLLGDLVATTGSVTDLHAGPGPLMIAPSLRYIRRFHDTAELVSAVARDVRAYDIVILLPGSADVTATIGTIVRSARKPLWSAGTAERARPVDDFHADLLRLVDGPVPARKVLP